MELPEYKPHKDRDLRIRSAVTAIKAILNLDLYPSHKKELISVCIWKITEADGKLRTRCRSIGSLTADSGTKLQHEHVFERKSLIQRLLDQREDVQVVLDDAIGCVVTKDEHDYLSQVSRENPDLEGWKRYRAAGIQVFDLQTQQEME